MDRTSGIAGLRDLEIPGFCGQRGQRDLFWSYNLTVNTSTPDFTLCFQRSVLLWIPCGWLLLASIFYIIYLTNKTRKHQLWQYSKLNLIKSICSLTLTVLTFVDLCIVLTSGEYNPPVNIMYYSIRTLTMFFVLVLTRWEFVLGFHTSGVLFIYWILQLICDIFILNSWIIRMQLVEAVNQTEFVIYCFYFTFTVISFCCQLLSDTSAINPPIIRGEYNELNPLLDETITLQSDDSAKLELVSKNIAFISEEGNANFDCTILEGCHLLMDNNTNKFFFRDIIRGNITLITFDKLYELRPFDTCRHLLPKFYTVFNREKFDQPMALRREGSSFLWALAVSTMKTMIFGVVAHSIGLFFRVLQPITMGWLIQWMETGNDAHIWQGLLLAGMQLIFGIFSTIFLHHYINSNWTAGMRARTVTNAVIYRKALRLSGSAKKNTTVGEILNLMSVDAHKIQDMVNLGILAGQAVVEITVCLVLIWTVIGPSTLAGLGVVVILVPINGYLVTEWIRKLQAKQMVYKDMRVKLINEVLAGIKIIKLYAWESSFLQRVIDTRKLELFYLKVANIIAGCSNVIWFLFNYLVTLAIFATFVLSSPANILDERKAFVTISLINVMNLLLSFLPLGVSYLGQGLVSVHRVSQFLDMDELEEDVVDQVSNIKECLSIRDASFSWEKEGEVVLQDINLDIMKGQLVAIVGHVGSGKSSLVSAMLGEMVKHSGYIKLNGSLAYVPQQAWIQNANMRDNILFGKNFEGTWYNSILDACALLQDLSILTDGDRTEIGEKGINISGGQKQRVSMARAVYQNEDVYLLDDPLSAVDSHVGKHIFNKVISNKGLLRHKTRILITHGINFLPEVDVVVVMKNGKISEIGHFDQLVENNGAFADFLQNYFNNSNQPSPFDEKDNDAIQAFLSSVSATESDLEGMSSGEPERNRKSKISHRKSNGKVKKLTEITEHSPAKLITEEIAEEGNVQWAIIRHFISAGGPKLFAITIVSLFLFMTTQVLTSFWISAWSSDVPSINGTMDAGIVRFRLGVYGALGIGQCVFATIMLVACSVGAVTASARLHSDLIQHIMHAPMSFFDTTPLGRILNRFSKDMDLIDSNIPVYVRLFLYCVGPVIATAFVVSYTTPIILVVLIPTAVIYLASQRMYIKYVRQLKRIDNIRRSPIYAHFDETINGASSIRAYGRQTEFINKCDDLIDKSQQPYYLIISAMRWLGVTMETIGSFITFFAALFVVLARDSLSSGSAGLSISYALSETMMLNALIRCITEVETYMVSVERVVEYFNITQEANWQKPETQTDCDWPREGAITIADYGTYYRPGLDLVLKSISCDIKAGEKVGIVGRTGAGKSSLALALFRLIEAAEGSISIDGINISTLGLHNLRSRITIIPQDPVIFSGSLRMNLDPFNEFNDEEVWTAITKAHLKSIVKAFPEQLNYECGEGGEALSVGQRQLVCLARALLRKTKVLVLDEATSAVDLETDALIQATIRDMFTECTILTIAHRLATVMDYDRIMVLDQGNIIEFDAPSKLIEKTDSVFYSLAKEAGMV